MSILADPEVVLTYSPRRPVPDGMALQVISRRDHPSNIAVFEAASIGEAVYKAFDAIAAGKQGAVWLGSKDLKRNGFISRKAFQEAVEAHIRKTFLGLKDVFRDVAGEHKRELFSLFAAHIDHHNSDVTDLDQRNGPLIKEICKELPIRVDDPIAGAGPILFALNLLMAAQLTHGKIEDPRLLGTAYQVATNSTLFIPSREWGLPRALIHSSPEVPARLREQAVREICLYNCRGLK